MADHHTMAGAPDDAGSRQTAKVDAETRMHSDVARQVDLERLEEAVMRAVHENSRAVGGLSGRVDGMRDELSGYVIQHAQDHVSFAGDWERRWSGITAEIAYRKGLIGLPRLILEWTRQYLATLLTIGTLAATILGFLTGAIDVQVGM